MPHLVLCVNKMDLVGWDKDVYDRIADEFTSFAAKLEITDLTIIPVSALEGDNIASRSDKSPWYEGPSLLHHLEHVHIAIGPQPGRRALPGAVRDPPAVHRRSPTTAATPVRSPPGVLKPGDEVMVLPSGMTSTISAPSTPPTARSTRRSRRCR